MRTHSATRGKRSVSAAACAAEQVRNHAHRWRRDEERPFSTANRPAGVAHRVEDALAGRQARHHRGVLQPGRQPAHAGGVGGKLIGARRLPVDVRVAAQLAAAQRRAGGGHTVHIRSGSGALQGDASAAQSETKAKRKRRRARSNGAACRRRTQKTRGCGSFSVVHSTRISLAVPVMARCAPVGSFGSRHASTSDCPSARGDARPPRKRYHRCGTRRLGSRKLRRAQRQCRRGIARKQCVSGGEAAARRGAHARAWRSPTRRRR